MDPCHNEKGAKKKVTLKFTPSKLLSNINLPNVEEINQSIKEHERSLSPPASTDHFLTIVPKPTLLGKQQAKKRLLAFSLSKLNTVSTPKKLKELKRAKSIEISEETFNEHGVKIEEVTIVKKPPKKGINHDEKAKEIIEEIETIKKIETTRIDAVIAHAQDLRENREKNEYKRWRVPKYSGDKNRRYEEEHKKRQSKEKTVRDYSDRKKHLEDIKPKKNYPKNWTEVKERDLNFFDIKQLNGHANRKCVDSINMLRIKSSSYQMNPLKYKAINGQEILIPAKYIRFTSKLPKISYSVNFNRIKHFFFNRQQVFEAIPKPQMDSIKTLIAQSGDKKPILPDSPLKLRKWFPKHQLANVDTDCQILEPSLGLSILQNYSDEEDQDLQTNLESDKKKTKSAKKKKKKKSKRKQKKKKKRKKYSNTSSSSTSDDEDLKVERKNDDLNKSECKQSPNFQNKDLESESESEQPSNSFECEENKIIRNKSQSKEPIEDDVYSERRSSKFSHHDSDKSLEKSSSSKTEYNADVLRKYYDDYDSSNKYDDGDLYKKHDQNLSKKHDQNLSKKHDYDLSKQYDQDLSKKHDYSLNRKHHSEEMSIKKGVDDRELLRSDKLVDDDLLERQYVKNDLLNKSYEADSMKKHTEISKELVKCDVNEKSKKHHDDNSSKTMYNDREFAHTHHDLLKRRNDDSKMRRDDDLKRRNDDKIKRRHDDDFKRHIDNFKSRNNDDLKKRKDDDLKSRNDTDFKRRNEVDLKRHNDDDLKRRNDDDFKRRNDADLLRRNNDDFKRHSDDDIKRHSNDDLSKRHDYHNLKHCKDESIKRCKDQIKTRYEDNDSLKKYSNEYDLIKKHSDDEDFSKKQKIIMEFEKDDKIGAIDKEKPFKSYGESKRSRKSSETKCMEFPSKTKRSKMSPSEVNINLQSPTYLNNKKQSLNAISYENSEQELRTPDTEEYHSHWESEEEIEGNRRKQKNNNSWESEEEEVVYHEHTKPKCEEKIAERSLEMPLNINLSRSRLSFKIVSPPTKKPALFEDLESKPSYLSSDDSWSCGEYLKMKNDFEIEELEKARRILTQDRETLEKEKREIAEMERKFSLNERHQRVESNVFKLDEDLEVTIKPEKLENDVKEGAKKRRSRKSRWEEPVVIKEEIKSAIEEIVGVIEENKSVSEAKKSESDENKSATEADKSVTEANKSIIDANASLTEGHLSVTEANKSGMEENITNVNIEEDNAEEKLIVVKNYVNENLCAKENVLMEDKTTLEDEYEEFMKAVSTETQEEARVEENRKRKYSSSSSSSDSSRSSSSANTTSSESSSSSTDNKLNNIINNPMPVPSPTVNVSDLQPRISANNLEENFSPVCRVDSTSSPSKNGSEPNKLNLEHHKLDLEKRKPMSSITIAKKTSQLLESSVFRDSDESDSEDKRRKLLKSESPKPIEKSGRSHSPQNQKQKPRESNYKREYSRRSSPPRRNSSPRSPRRRITPPRKRRDSPVRRRYRDSPPRHRYSPVRRGRDHSPRYHSPRRNRSLSPYTRKRSLSKERKTETIQETLHRIAGLEYEKPKSPPVEGFIRSLADSTISDDQLLQNQDEYSESPGYYNNSAQFKPETSSPKRIPLDDRINQVLGIEKEEPRPISTTYSQNYPNYTQGYYDQYYADYEDNKNYKDFRQREIKNIPMTTTKVLQVGNVLQVVPTEDIPPVKAVSKIPPKVDENAQRIVQVGNMLQIVPTTMLPPAKEVVAATIVPPPKEKQSAEDLMKLKVAESKAEREKRRQERDRRRKEKERKRKDREKRKQMKIKLKTEEMIKRALLIDTEGNEEQEENFESEAKMFVPSIISTGSRPTGKGILVFHNRKLESKEFLEKPKKGVKFADGVIPGEGTSPSAGEELSSPPPVTVKVPKEKRYTKTKKPKKPPKKKIKVKIIRKSQSKCSFEDEEEDNLPPPSPPPGSPPSHVFPPRIKPTINNFVPTYQFNPGVVNCRPTPESPFQHYPPIQHPPPIHHPPPAYQTNNHNSASQIHRTMQNKPPFSISSPSVHHHLG